MTSSFCNDFPAWLGMLRSPFRGDMEGLLRRLLRHCAVVKEKGPFRAFFVGMLASVRG